MNNNSNIVPDDNQYDEEKLLQKLQEDINKGNPLDFYRELLGENIFNFYFSDNGTDVSEVLSDSMSEGKWDTLLEKHRQGKITSEELVDVIKLSHLHAVERSNPYSTPEEIVDRSFESKLKGRIGQKLITATIGALSDKNLLTAPKEAVLALVNYETAKNDPRATSKQQDKKFLPTEQLKSVADDAHKKFVDSLNVTDLIRDITTEELLGRLSDQEDPYFGITHQIIFDMGWEKPTREASRASQKDERFLSLYVCELDKAWTDTVKSNVKESDRRVTRYIVRDVKTGDLETLNKIRDKIIQVYCERFQEKIDFFIKKLW